MQLDPTDWLEAMKALNFFETLEKENLIDLGLAFESEENKNKIEQLEEKVESEKTLLIELQKTSKMIKEDVDAEEIADVVSKWTGIPVSKMLEGEKTK